MTGPVPSATPDQPSPPEVDGEHEACPTPLAWQQVVLQTHDEAEAFRDSDDERTALCGLAIGSGPPLWICPGMQGGPELLYLTAHLLKEDYRVHVVRWPETFRSDADELVSRLESLMRHASDEPAVVIGTGFGGQIATLLAEEHPQRVASLILHATRLRAPLTLRERLLLWAGKWLPLRVGVLPGEAAVETNNHRPWFPPFDHSRFQFYLENVQATKLSSLAERALLAHRTDAHGRLANTSCPLLLIRTEGEGERVAEAMEEAAQERPDACVEWMHSSGLLPFLTHPHRVRRLLLTHLGKLS